jgi:hypothetical protein
MPYTKIDRCYHISKYSSFKYGQKVTEKQLKTAIFLVIRSTDEKAIESYIKAVVTDYSPLAKPQFEQKDGYYEPTPNRPKTPNQLIADAYQESQKQKEGSYSS